MSTYVPDGCIRCENCNKFFNRYVFLKSIIDTDSYEEASREAVCGVINRVTCPYCKTEFTYESPLMLHSYSNKIIAVAATNDELFNAFKLSLALKISGACDWSLRRCEFARDAAEKIRIFTYGLNDAAIELMKLRYIPGYAELDLFDEYIVFDKITETDFVFTLRDYTDKITRTYSINKQEYDKIPKETIPTAEWITIDRNYVLKLEETK